MNGADKRDKEEFRENLRKEFGFTEEQLLREMEEAETASVDDSMFDGVEDRMFQKLMERKAEDEKREAQGKEAEKAEGQAAEPETKKVVRFGKRKAVLSVALVAAFALALGTTAIGGKSYFLRRVGDGKSQSLVIDNDKNKVEASSIEDAYQTISTELDIPVLKMEYVPTEMKFEEVMISENRALTVFDLNGQKIHFIQEKHDSETSIDPQSDRKEKNIQVYNRLLKQTIQVEQNSLNDGFIEYGVEIHIKEYQYRLIGVMEEQEFIKIVKFLNFY